VTFTAYSRANAMVAVNYSIWRMRIGFLSAPALRERSLRPQSI
jgi:hypothetical protein